MKKTIFILLLFFLMIPKIQEELKIFNNKKLKGTVIPTLRPEFSWTSWINGEFQNQFNEFTNEDFGLRNSFIRFYNQIDYSFFSKTRADVIIGKKGYLFESVYVNEVIGKSYIGDSLMKSKITKIKRIEDYLNKKNKLLVTILAPGKTDYYKEYLPEYYAKRITEKRNYNLLTKYAEDRNINLIDFNKWILQLKDTSRYTLFPKQGIHWSYYCMALCADSIVKYIEKVKKVELRNFSWTLELPNEVRGTDSDLGDLLNIYRKIPFDQMAYPVYKYEEDTAVSKPKILVIGDSFYWTIFNDQIFKNIFGKETFFYYFNSIFPKENAPGSWVPDLYILKEIESYDAVLLFQSSGNYDNPGLNFAEVLDIELTKFDQLINRELSTINENEHLLYHAKNIADSMKISTENAKQYLAEKRVNNYFERLSEIKIKMRSNPQWMQDLYIKSNEQKKTIEQTMEQDAEWMIKVEDSNN